MTSTAETLRLSFDRSFAARPSIVESASSDMLAIRIGGDPYALRLAELAAVHVDRVIVQLPSPLPELLGLAALRGTLVPIYDLGALIGYSREGATRWIAITRPPRMIGLAFEIYERHVRVAAENVVAVASLDSTRCIRDVVNDSAGVARPILDIASLIDTVEKRATAPSKE